MRFTVPTWLADRNEASWRDVVGFLEHVALDCDTISPLLRVARYLSLSEYAKSFRAGNSLAATLIISTAWQCGLEYDDAFVAISLGSGNDLQLKYCIANRDETLEERQCPEADINLQLTPLLGRLWNDRLNQHEVMKRSAKKSQFTK